MRMTPIHSRRHSAYRRQRGAVGLFAALVLILAVLFTALAVDTGRLAMEKQKLQSIADLSALHAAGAATCGGTDIPDQATVAAAAQQVALANGYAGNLSTEPGGVTLGTTQTMNGVRQFATVASLSDADAVRVIATSDFPTSLVLPSFITGNTRLQATAVASKQILAGFQLGSFLARLNTGDSVLNPLLGGMLGTSLSLDLVSYKGIAAAQVSLLNLVNAAAGVGTVDELLNTQLSVTQFLNILVTAVGPSSTAGVALNQMLPAGVGALPNIKLADILSVTAENPQSALDAKINAFDLLNATLQLANKQHAVSVPALNVNLSPIVSLGMSLYVIEPPKIAIGPPGRDSAGKWRTEVSTAQLRLQLDVSALDLNLGLISTGVKLSLYLDAAKANAHLKSVQCATAADHIHHVVIGVQPSLVSLGIGQYSDITSGTVQPTPALQVNALGLTVADVTISAATSVQNPSPEDLTFNIAQTPIPSPPPPELTQTADTSAGNGLSNAIGTLSNSLNIQVNVLPALNNPLLILVKATIQGLLNTLPGVLAPILQTLLAAIGNLVLDPLLTALGIQLGGADVTVIWLEIKPTLLAI
ncbi:MAG: pilus assembly protein TadG-related protein [Methylomonas sp.]